MNDATRPETAAIERASMPTVLPNPAFSLVPKNLDEALRFAKLLSQSELVPKDYQGKEANCFVAMQWGLELGLPPLQAIQNIAVINGRPRLWGDAMIALVRSNPLCDYIEEEMNGTQATCTAKRRGDRKPVVRTFTLEDAKKAELAGKDTYKKYGPRMLQMRARDWCLRDAFPDVLRGMGAAEVALMDAEIDVTSQGSHTTEPPQQPGTGGKQESTKPGYSKDDFDKNLPTWRKHINAGKKTPADVIATVESKYTLSADQKDAIEGKDTVANDEDVKALLEEAAKASITDAEIAKHLGVEKLDGITIGQLSRAVAFVADPTGAAQ